MFKICNKCKKELPATLEIFHKNKACKDGLNYFCKDCQKIIYENNTKRAIKHTMNYYEKNKEEVLRKQHEYKQKNLEKIKKHSKEYRHTETAMEMRKIVCHQRRSLQNKLESNYSVKQWEQCKAYFNNKCAYCGEEKPLEQEHFIAVAKSGEYTSNNIIPACRHCNQSKRDRDFFTWYSSKKYYSKKREQKILKYLNYDSKTKLQQLALA